MKSVQIIIVIIIGTIYIFNIFLILKIKLSFAINN